LSSADIAVSRVGMSSMGSRSGRREAAAALLAAVREAAALPADWVPVRQPRPEPT